MPDYQVVKVADASTTKQFYDVPLRIYRNDQNWVAPLEAEIDAIFYPSQNRLFNDGDACRWIALNEKNECCGRIRPFSTGEKYMFLIPL